MGQEEIYNFLEENKDSWYCALDIKKEFNDEYCINSITKALKKLLNAKDIKCKIEKKYKTNKETRYYQIA